MGSVRVTQRMLTSRTLTNISEQLRRVSVYQERLGTGLKVNYPSDNPIDARRAINTRVQIAKSEQYIKNIDSAGPQLLETVTSVQSLISTVQRARELTLQGGSGTNAQEQRDSIALEVNQLLEGVLVEGNHKTEGQYIFGGSRTLSEPFSATRNAQGEITSVTYNGNTANTSVDVAEGISVETNVAGSEMFQGTVDIFQTLIDIRDDLRAGNQNNLNTTHLDALTAAQNQFSQVSARVGAIQNRVERISNDTTDVVFRLQELLSDTIDADYSDTVINLNSQSNALSAALQAGGMVMQPSLLDYIR